MAAPLQNVGEVAPREAVAVEANASSKSRRRWEPLDYFRFGAVLLMVQGHAFNVFIDEAIRPETWYRWHGYVHGYTAPMFLFAAGLAFGVTTFRGWDKHLSFNRTVFRRLERYLLIVGIGYLLHLPGFAVSGLWNASDAQLRNLLKVDALQNIGVTLIFCELAVLALRRRTVYVAVAGAIGTILAIAAPWVWNLEIGTSLPPVLAAYVNNETGSIFPLFPWSAFILFGIVSAHFIERYREKYGERPGADVLVTAGAAIVGAAWLIHTGLHKGGIDLFGDHNFWKTNPLWFLWRIGIVVLLLAILAAVADFIRRRSNDGAPGPVRRTIQVLGQETLVIYVVHLIALYGSPFHIGFNRSVGKTLPVDQAFWAFTVLMALMVVLAWGWHWIKTKRPNEFTVGRLILLGAVLVYVCATG
ncbi:MAG: heparan-alpha-glucosaminide N-acetyltransferase domain-containing protein [Myxococcota bacterium]